MASWFDRNATLRIGTRGSALALAQAHQVRDLLIDAHGLPADRFAIEVLKTTGDAVLDRPLSEIGGKGLFTKELDAALAAGRIDIAVHSMKDVPTVLPDGMAITAVLPREDVRDVLVSDHVNALDALPHGAVFGTSSLRRRAQLLNRRPDLRMVEFRGNVQTRLQKLADGVATATILARAGLNRLGQSELGTTLSVDTLLPAVAQGVIGIQQRHNGALSEALAPLHHAATAAQVTAERAFLRILDGSCRTPIAALARFEGDTIQFTGEVLSPDGARVLRTGRVGDDPARVGVDAAQELLALGAANLY